MVKAEGTPGRRVPDQKREMPDDPSPLPRRRGQSFPLVSTRFITLENQGDLETGSILDPELLARLEAHIPEVDKAWLRNFTRQERQGDQVGPLLYGYAFQELRLSEEVSQLELAEKLDIQQTQIAVIETSAKKPGVKIVDKYLQAKKISQDSKVGQLLYLLTNRKQLGLMTRDELETVSFNKLFTYLRIQKRKSNEEVADAIEGSIYRAKYINEEGSSKLKIKPSEVEGILRLFGLPLNPDESPLTKLIKNRARSQPASLSPAERDALFFEKILLAEHLQAIRRHPSIPAEEREVIAEVRGQENFGNGLRVARERLIPEGQSLATKVAQATGRRVTERQIKNYEDGVTNPDESTVIFLLKGFQRTLHDELGWALLGQARRG